MKRIVFKDVLPHVFSDRADMDSDIWKSDAVFEKGHLYLVEAASGMGKSTFCSYLLGYRHDYTGSIMFGDDDVRGYKTADWVRVRMRHVSLLFQELRLFPELTAWENVEIKNRLTSFADSTTIDAWFERLGIADKKQSLVGEMSFGQQQRVALKRALVQPYDFIVLDEPISHLDDDNARVMGQIVMEEARKQGAGVVMTSIGKHIDLDYEKIYRL